MRDRSLRRPADRVEDAAAWLLTVAAIVVVVVAGVLGHGGYLHGMERVRAEQASRVQVAAVLLQDPPQVAAERGSTSPWVRVPARWIDRSGQPRESEIIVRTNARAGQPVRVWIDERGEPTRAPADRLSAVSSGLSAAIGLLIVAAGVIWAAWAGLRRAVLAHNTRMWEREWARVGPEWTSQQPT